MVNIFTPKYEKLTLDEKNGNLQSTANTKTVAEVKTGNENTNTENKMWRDKTVVKTESPSNRLRLQSIKR